MSFIFINKKNRSISECCYGINILTYMVIIQGSLVRASLEALFGVSGYSTGMVGDIPQEWSIGYLL